MIFTTTRVLHHSSTQDPYSIDDENELDKEYLHGRVHVNLVYDEKEEEDIPRIERVTYSDKRISKVITSQRKNVTRTLQVGDALQA